MAPKERMAYLKALPLWTIVEKEIDELVENGDLELTTAHDIVVGSLVSAIEGGTMSYTRKNNRH